MRSARSPRSSTGSSPVKRTAAGKRRAKLVIDFIEKLTVPSGKGQGKLFELAKWQKDFIRDIYEPHRNGRRVVRRAILSIARKNGKTALIAAIALAHLVGPEAESNGEIYSAANDRDQAAIVFKFAGQIVELEPESARADRDHRLDQDHARAPHWIDLSRYLGRGRHQARLSCRAS